MIDIKVDLCVFFFFFFLYKSIKFFKSISCRQEELWIGRSFFLSKSSSRWYDTYLHLKYFNSFFFILVKNESECGVRDISDSIFHVDH